MILDEIRAANQLVEDFDDIKELDDDAKCDCKFYQKYQLPCRDIWASHFLFGTLVEDDFRRWAFMWEDSGFEIYETMGSAYFAKDIDDEIGAPTRRRLDMREALDTLKSKYYDLEDLVAKMPGYQAEDVMRWWIGKLEKMTGPLRSIGIAEFREELQQQYRVKPGATNAFGGDPHVWDG